MLYLSTVSGLDFNALEVSLDILAMAEVAERKVIETYEANVLEFLGAGAANNPVDFDL